MKYHLMSPHTSLVAVEKGQGDDETREHEDMLTIHVPSMVPEGLEYDAFAYLHKNLSGKL